MVPNKWGIRLAMAGMFFLVVLACSSPTELFIAEATATSTRTPRPTFTPLPKATDLPTLMPTLPPPPTSAPATQVSVKATAKPPTAKPPTAKPAATKAPTQAPVVQPTSPPPPPPTAAPRFEYAANPASCAHAGNQYIKGRVYDSGNPSANGVPSLKMALGGADGNNSWVTTNNEDDGFYTFTLSIPGGGTNPAGAYYVWILDKSGKRISDVGGPINLNPVGPDAAGTCWAGSVDFWRR